MSAYLDEAVAIGDRLAAEAIFSKDRCTWIGRAFPETVNLVRQQPDAEAIASSIYGGTAGVALFLTHLSRFTNSADHARAARGAIRHALAIEALKFENPGRYQAFEARNGFYSGGLGVAWAAAEIGGLLGDADIESQSVSLVSRLHRARKKAKHDDLIFGSAGAIPALLDLHRRGHAEALPFAVDLGRDLVKKADRTGGVYAWSGINKTWYRPLTGYSHGASGIAWALALLSKATGDATFRDAAEGGIAYERSTFLEDRGNWPDLRARPGAKGQRAMIAWCHGAPGIGLARVLLADLLDETSLLKEARIARETTRRDLEDSLLATPGSNFMYCHGVAGNAETLWLLEDGLDVPDAHAAAARVADHGLARYGEQARERWGSRFVSWPTGLAGSREPSLMKGVSGIGLFLLRVHEPSRVPSILVPGTPTRAA